MFRRINFIAQEIKEIFPNAVSGTEEDPNLDHTEIEKPMTVSKPQLIPFIVKSIQDQQKQIEALEKRIKKLEKK